MTHSRQIVQMGQGSWGLAKRSVSDWLGRICKTGKAGCAQVLVCAMPVIQSLTHSGDAAAYAR